MCVCVCVCRLCPALKAVFEHGLKKSTTLCVCVCRLCPALKAVFEHGLKKSTIMGGHCHPWLFIEEVCLPASATFFLWQFGLLLHITSFMVEVHLSLPLYFFVCVTVIQHLFLFVTVLPVLLLISILSVLVTVLSVFVTVLSVLVTVFCVLVIV